MSSVMGAWTIKETVALVRANNPQLIHTDPSWSATGPFGGLIARGVNRVAVCRRLDVGHHISQVANLASPGQRGTGGAVAAAHEGPPVRWAR